MTLYVAQFFHHNFPPEQTDNWLIWTLNLSRVWLIWVVSGREHWLIWVVSGREHWVPYQHQKTDGNGRLRAPADWLIWVIDGIPHQDQKADENGRLQVSRRKIAKSKKNLWFLEMIAIRWVRDSQKFDSQKCRAWMFKRLLVRPLPILTEGYARQSNMENTTRSTRG